MKISPWIALGVASHALLVASLCAQVLPKGPPSARLMQLEANTAKLNVAVALDRSEYLPGETAEVTISVVNPTVSVVEAFEPFRRNTGVLHVALQPGTEQKTIARPSQDFWAGRLETAPTHLFAASESLTRTLHSYDDHFDSHTMRLFAVPDYPGEFQLEYSSYSYRATPAKFRVIPAVMSLVSFVPLQKQGQYKSGDKMVSYARNVALLALQAGGKHYVVASWRDSVTPFIQRTPDGSFADPPRRFSPLVRIFTSDQPIVALSGAQIVQPPGSGVATGTQQGQESIAVSWMTADGKRSTVNLGADRKPMP
jgi:hypothetical protein